MSDEFEVVIPGSEERAHLPPRDERMGKAAMLKDLEEDEAGASRAAVLPTKVAKKRKSSTPAEKEARCQRKKIGASSSGAQPKQTTEGGRAPTPPMQTTEELPELPPVITIAEAYSPSKNKGPGRVPPLDLLEDSLVVSPSRAVATRRWLGGEVIKRLTRAHRAVNDTRQSFNEAIGQHSELVVRLEELEAIRAQEKRVAGAEKEVLEAQLAAESVARASEEETIRFDLDAVLAKKTTIEVELEETKARAQEEAERLRSEAFRAKGYAEEEHQTSFLNLKKALMDMADEEAAEEEEEEEEEEDDEADATPPELP
ncbi:SET and MYND domain-containing protein [Dorcoceras hygrometricum]|uniref:SET and MYND domain-containing protein n=1 Tax=Dorcoceras hygrometricum TaxID=472368 RepID=A0A2Z7AHM1_9LAMI|nr:SET and MYND domain-containing protein [Dorcoceras hygrometricum]